MSLAQEIATRYRDERRSARSAARIHSTQYGAHIAAAEAYADCYRLIVGEMPTEEEFHDS